MQIKAIWTEIKVVYKLMYGIFVHRAYYKHKSIKTLVLKRKKNEKIKIHLEKLF